MEELLKQAMVQAAVQATCQGEGEPAPVSRLSVITSIHRKEVKRLLEPTAPAQLAASVTPAAELFTRWLTSRDWQSPDGKPLALPRRPSPYDSPNFEMLARNPSQSLSSRHAYSWAPCCTPWPPSSSSSKPRIRLTRVPLISGSGSVCIATLHPHPASPQRSLQAKMTKRLVTPLFPFASMDAAPSPMRRRALTSLGGLAVMASG